MPPQVPLCGVRHRLIGGGPGLSGMLTRSWSCRRFATQQVDLDVSASHRAQFLQHKVIHRGCVRFNDRARLRILGNGWEQRRPVGTWKNVSWHRRSLPR